METIKEKHAKRVLRGERQGDDPNDTSPVRCPVCGKVQPSSEVFTYICDEYPGDDIELCLDCVDAFESEYDIRLDPADLLPERMFARMWKWIPTYRAGCTDDWERLNKQLFKELIAVRDITKAKRVSLQLDGDTVQFECDGNFVYFSMQDLHKYRGDALNDIILSTFGKKGN
jgi:hypothetical protein